MIARYPFAVIREKLSAHKRQVADFAIGSQPLPLPEPLAQWITEHAALATRPASLDDVARFRDAAATFLAQEYGVDSHGLGVLPASGGRNAMSAFAVCMLAPRDLVLVTEPGYPAIARLASQRGALVRTVLLQPGRGFAPDFSALEAEDLQSVKAVCVNYPNNPTGAIVSEALIASLGRILEGGATLLNDAVYGPLCYDSKPRSLLTTGAGASSRTLELHALTKLYPLGPLSISFLAGSKDLVAPIAAYSEYAWSVPSALQLGATTWCLHDRAGLVERRDFLAAQVQMLHQTLKRVGFRPFPTPAGPFVLCAAPRRLRGRALDSAAAAALQLMDEFDLAVVPWDVGTSRYLRFSALYRPEDLERLAALADALDVDSSD